MGHILLYHDCLYMQEGRVSCNDVQRIKIDWEATLSALRDISVLNKLDMWFMSTLGNKMNFYVSQKLSTVTPFWGIGAMESPNSLRKGQS